MATEKRLIDANALKRKAEPEEVTGEGIVYVQDIDEAPTVDAVEVVRCKECKHWDQCPYQPNYGQCIRVDYDPPVTYGDDYCSYGERKDND